MVFLQFSFEIFQFLNIALAPWIALRYLQFSFEIFVEPEVRVVRDRILKTLQFSFEIFMPANAPMPPPTVSIPSILL